MYLVDVAMIRIIQFTERPSSYVSRTLTPSGPLSYLLTLSYNRLGGGPLPNGKINENSTFQVVFLLFQVNSIFKWIIDALMLPVAIYLDLVEGEVRYGC